MGRLIAGVLAPGGLLFSIAAVGLVASWGLVVGVLFLTAGGVVLAIALEERDLAAAPPPPVTPAVDPVG